MICCANDTYIHSRIHIYNRIIRAATVAKSVIFFGIFIWDNIFFVHFVSTESCLYFTSIELECTCLRITILHHSLQKLICVVYSSTLSSIFVAKNSTEECIIFFNLLMGFCLFTYRNDDNFTQPRGQNVKRDLLVKHKYQPST